MNISPFRPVRGFPSAILALVALASIGLSQAGPARAWMDKIDPALGPSSLETPSGEVDFIVVLAEQADLSGASLLSTKAEKGAFVFQQLTETAQRSQPAVLSALEAKGLKGKPFWIANMIQVRGPMSALQELAERADVAAISANPTVQIQAKSSELPQGPTAPAAISPNVSKIRAPEAWALGFRGQGIVIGGLDSGVQWDHPALKENYRGWLGFAANHAYDWHDATSGAGSCRNAPCDPNGHGTHTIGVAVGDDDSTNQIGVAPGAQWIACRAIDQDGMATPATYSECLQWFIAPTDLQGENPSSRVAPDILNNSWECEPSDGCTNPALLQTLIKNVRAAGIVVVANSGNDGPNCSTVQHQPAINAASITVGATDINDNIAGFSSRGPVTIDGSNRLKPDLTAPGVSIRSSVPGNAYANLSGTSMSAPHVAGTAALLLSARPDLSGDVDDIQSVLEETALPLTTVQTCGGVAGSTIPNHTFGWGRIDALAAVISTPPPTPTPTPTPTATPTPTPTPTPPTTLANISTRLRVETGDNVLIGGFIITGTQDKKVIVRGIGTSLPFADKLENPTLELRNSSGALLDSNDNWVDSPNKQAIIDSTIPPGSDFESAIVATLAANNSGYTAIVRGTGDGTGIGVVEAYDLDSSADSKLANISTRGLVQTGDNVLIAGTIVIGQTSQKVIIRAIGPSLPIAGKMENPTLELRDSNGALLQDNDNWVDSDEKQAIIDTTIPPANDLESAIVATLPGNNAAYTAIVRGVNDTTGIAVVEVYALQ